MNKILALAEGGWFEDTSNQVWIYSTLNLLTRYINHVVIVDRTKKCIHGPIKIYTLIINEFKIDIIVQYKIFLCINGLMYY